VSGPGASGERDGCLSGLADSAGGMFESPLPGKSPRSDESHAMRFLPRLVLPGGSGRCACPSALSMLPHIHAYWPRVKIGAAFCGPRFVNIPTGLPRSFTGLSIPRTGTQEPQW